MDVDARSGYARYHDEAERRRSVHLSLDEALSDVRRKGLPDRPSDNLYNGGLAQETLMWERRWWTARLLDLSVRDSAVGSVLAQVGKALGCRMKALPSAQLGAFLIGQRVHRVIQQRFLDAKPRSIVSCDNRVFSPSHSSAQLASLAKTEPFGVYGALAFALARGRPDILDLGPVDSSANGKMWEIKPLALASTALLQLWAYLDNYETARVFSRYADRTALQPIGPGTSADLPLGILEPIVVLRFPVKVIALPVTSPTLPGLILYTLALGPGKGRRRALSAAAADGRVAMSGLLAAAGAESSLESEANLKMWEMAEHIAAAVQIACITTEVALLATVALPVGAIAAGAAEVELAAGAAELGQGAIVHNIFRESTRQAIQEVAKKAAAVTVFSTGSRQFEVPTAAGAKAIETGVQIGVQ